MSPVTERAEFRNDSGHVVGVSTRRARGEMKGLAVQPGETIWLDEEEQIATANAPREDADNPFTNGDLTLVTEPKEIVNRRQIGYSDHKQVGDLAEEETGPGGDTGSPDGDGSAGSGGAGDDDPPAPPKAPEDPPKAPPETPQEPQGQQGGTPPGKVPPPNLTGRQTPEQEAQAKAAAARALKTATVPKQPGDNPAKAGEGKAADDEVVGTPEAQGK